MYEYKTNLFLNTKYDLLVSIIKYNHRFAKVITIRNVSKVNDVTIEYF